MFVLIRVYVHLSGLSVGAVNELYFPECLTKSPVSDFPYPEPSAQSTSSPNHLNSNARFMSSVKPSLTPTLHPAQSAI